MVEYFLTQVSVEWRETMGPSSDRPIGPTGSAGQMVCGEEHSTGGRVKSLILCVSLTWPF